MKPTTRNLPTSPTHIDNVGAKVGQMLDRFYFEQGWNIKRNTQDEIDEHKNRVHFWILVLASERIPLAEFDEIYLRCISNRARAKAGGQNVANKLNPEDFLAAWFQIQSDREAKAREAQKERVSDYTPNCPYRHGEPKTAMMYQVNPYNFNEDILLPCGFCRPLDYEQARKDFINTSGEINPLDILNNVVNGDFGKAN